ncbi:MAG: hypothetical protein L3J08_09005 [Flavobacteriaceae bacterium]|nr:hypothetical protein [Flavobacteriaceae bacterium]
MRTGQYSNYSLSTVEIFEENKEEGTSVRKGIKYIVMTNNKKVIDYMDLQELHIPKKYLLHDEVWLNDKRDWELFAYAEQNDSGEQFIKDIYKVFRADKETDKIFEISKKAVKVQDLDYGF